MASKCAHDKVLKAEDMALLPCHSPGTPVLWTVCDCAVDCPGKALVATVRVGRPRTIVQARAGSPGSYSIADQRPYTRNTDFSKGKHHFGVAKVPRKVMTTGYQSLGLADFYCRCQLEGLEISTEEWCYSAGLHSKVPPNGGLNPQKSVVSRPGGLGVCSQVSA